MGVGVGVEVEQPPAADHRGTEIGDAGKPERRPYMVVARLDRDDADPARQTQRAAVHAAAYLLHAGDGARGEPADRADTVVRATNGQPQGEPPGFRALAAAARAAQLGRGLGEDLADGLVE